MSPAGATILVVDDEPTVLDTVRDGLTAHGYQVLKASGGEEALQVVQGHQGAIALALVDVVMPGMSGPEVVQAHGYLSLRLLTMPFDSWQTWRWLARTFCSVSLTPEGHLSSMVSALGRSPSPKCSRKSFCE